MKEDILKKANNLQEKIRRLKSTLEDFVIVKRTRKKPPLPHFDIKINKTVWNFLKNCNDSDYVYVDDQEIVKEIMQVIETILRKHLEKAKKEFNKL